MVAKAKSGRTVSKTSKTTSKKSTASGNGRVARRNASSNGAVDAKSFKGLTAALRAVKAGDFSVRLPGRRGTPNGDMAVAFNELVDHVDKMTKEFARISRVVGREGRMTERLRVPQAKGDWITRINSVNSLIDDLVRPTT